MDGLYEQLRIALHTVWMRRWLALAVAWGLCLVGWLVIAIIPSSYEAKARIYVESSDVLPNTMANGALDHKNDLVRLKQTLTSTDNLERAVRHTDLNLQVASDRDLAAQVASLGQKIKVTEQQDGVFEIAVTSSVSGFSDAQNARTSAAIVQALIDGFVEQNLAGDQAQAGQTLKFIDEELARREGELREAEQRRVDFQTKYMGDLPGEGSATQRISAAQMELSNIDQQMIAAQSGLVAARSQLTSTPATMVGPGSEGAGGATGEMASLQAQLSQLRAKGYRDSHPDVVAIQSQMTRLRPQAEAERRSGAPVGNPNPLYVTLKGMVTEREAQVAALQTRKSQLQADMAQLANKQSSEPELAAQLDRLNRDYDVLKSQYDKLLQDREQLRLRSDVNSKTDALKFRVIQRPSVPSAPAKPNRPLLLTLVLFVAIAGGIGAAFAKGQLQTSFPTQNRLEQISGLPVLGSISQVMTDATRAFERQRLRWFAGAGGALFAAYIILMTVEFWQLASIA